VSTIHTFGCKATLATSKKNHDKLASHSIPRVHLGLTVSKKVFVIYDPDTCHIHESCDIHFFEGTKESECVSIEAPGEEPLTHVVGSDSLGPGQGNGQDIQGSNGAGDGDSGGEGNSACNEDVESGVVEPEETPVAPCRSS